MWVNGKRWGGNSRYWRGIVLAVVTYINSHHYPYPRGPRELCHLFVALAPKRTGRDAAAVIGRVRGGH